MIGRKLGHYEVLEKLGEGGMGAVYRARDTTLGREVALKLLPEFVAADREKIARLEREARLLASLSHPNVATLHGLEESSGLKYLVMELVPGETLASRIAQGPLRLEECLGVFRQIAEGLEAAHEKGVIHRDLKPANVVVTPEGRVKILDFGLAKAMAEEAPSSDLSKSPTLTREGTEQGVILGTASYMSPEQARGKTLDRRTDIWSFGCVFYEALTGKKAFTGETVSDILAAILEREPDWTALPQGTPTKIRELLLWCLQKDLLRRLRDIGDARFESAAPPATVAAPRRFYIPWAAAALASFAAVWSFLQPRPEPDRVVSRVTVVVPPEQALTWVNDPAVALSPDGRRLVYVGGRASERMLYVRLLDQLEARPIPGTEGASTVFFSPDGEWVGFYGDDRTLRKVKIDSGVSVALAAASDAWGGSWGSEGSILYSPGGAGLALVSASGGASSTVTRPDPERGEVSHRWPEILPDGKAALFTILAATGAPRVGLLNMETGEWRALLDGAFARYVPTGHLVYLSEGVLQAVPFDLERLALTGKPFPLPEEVQALGSTGTAHFSFSQDGTLVYVPKIDARRRLVWIDRRGHVRSVSEELRFFEDPRLSPDGEKIAFMILENGRSDIWVYEIARDSFTRLSFGAGMEQAPIWTPDGKWVAYRGGSTSNLYWQRASGSDPEERLTTSLHYQRADSWSPASNMLVYLERTRGSVVDENLWLLSLDGERTARPLLNAPFRESQGALSPDGGFLAYTSDESGRFEIYVRPFPDLDEKWPISNEGGTQAVWARSGRELFYRNGDKMMAVAIEAEPAFRAGKPAVLFEGRFHGPQFSNPQYDVTPDGESFIMIQEFESSSTQIHVVLNWFEELKARVPVPKR